MKNQGDIPFFHEQKIDLFFTLQTKHKYKKLLKMNMCNWCVNQPKNFGEKFCSDECMKSMERHNEQNVDEAHYCDKCQENKDKKCTIYKNQFLCEICHFYEVFVYCEDCCAFIRRKDEDDSGVSTLCDHCLETNEIISRYSEEQQQALRMYAEDNCMTIAEAIEYQMCCYSCDETNRQYCEQRCFGEGICRVCSIWQYDENGKYNEIMKQKQVLMAIEVFKELKVYGSLLACVPDLSEYF